MAIKTLNELANQLKIDILESIEDEVFEICLSVVRDNIEDRVYRQYTPNGEYAYDRTMQLMDCVSVQTNSVGSKYIKAEVYMDTDKIRANITGDGQWNQHADVWNADVSEMIPFWVEHGTSGSLWDRPSADYMEQSHHKLDGGILAKALERGLRSRGWKVVAL